MNIEFTKGHGTGNDFVLIADFDGVLDLTEEQIQLICDRHFGIGADGLILVTKTENSEVAHLLHDEPNAEWFMDYRNADGSKAEMCGNGIRCFAQAVADEIAAAIAEKAEISKKQATAILEIIAALAYKNAKNSFTLPGLGKLVLVHRKARQGRNPATGETIQIKAKKVVKFRVAKAAKDAILGAK